MKVSFGVYRETEKAYEIEVSSAMSIKERYIWVPKSICKTERFVATVNPVTNKPETYGTRVVEIADWWCNKNL